MKRAIRDLAGFPDERLFAELSVGIPLIVQNAVSLDETARSLHQQSNHRGAEVFSGFAEEEAAKVLILIDLLRCPENSGKRGATAQYFYGHVAKRIYAMTCWYPRISSFREFCDFVKNESEPYYLDGPNLVDWILWNSILAERDQSLYVDYVQDVTVEAGAFHWRTPFPSLPTPYQTPECVKLVQALLDAGAVSPDSLAVIAGIWRAFEPTPDTTRRELRSRIAYTLNRLVEAGLSPADKPLLQTIITSWSFPLWPLEIQKPRAKQEDLLEELREERARTVARIEETESKRDPPPAISRAKVQELSDAYMTWKREVETQNSIRTSNAGGLRIRTDIEKDLELPSYKHLESKFQTLTEEERAALMALSWFTRDKIANWPSNYERAINMVTTTENTYQIGLGHDWLAGLDRWEEKPRRFEAGQWYRP